MLQAGQRRERREKTIKVKKKSPPEITSHTAATLYLTVIFAEDLHGNPADHSAQNKSRNYFLSSAT